MGIGFQTVLRFLPVNSTWVESLDEKSFEETLSAGLPRVAACALPFT